MTFDATTNTLFGVDSATAQRLTIDSSTGVGTAVGAHGFTRIDGLTFVPEPSTALLVGVAVVRRRTAARAPNAF